MKKCFLASAIAALFISTSLAQAAPLLVDSFESGDMSATSADGFRWGQNNRTSVVTEDAVVWSNGEKNTAIPDGRDWTAQDGNHSLRFRYEAGEYMSEQRFALGKHYKDVWFRYWIRVPMNYSHGSLNNKWLSLWVDTYDIAGTVTWQTRPDGNGGARLVVQDGGVTNGESLATPFISVPGDRGKWMQVVAHVKAASAAGANDGVIQFYRRWEGESKFTKLHEKLNANTWESGATSQGIANGYIMGWANDAYDADTEWLLDQFTVSTESLLDDTGSTANPPSAPTLRLQ